MGFPGGASGKESARQCRRRQRCGLDPWVRKMPWRGKWQPTAVYLPGETPWTEEPGGLPSIGLQRVRHDWSDRACACTHTHIGTYTHISQYIFILKYFFHSVIWVSSKRPIRSLQHLFSSMPFEIFFYPFLPLAPFFSSCLLFLSIFICTASNISFISVMILMFSSSSSWDFQT